MFEVTFGLFYKNLFLLKEICDDKLFKSKDIGLFVDHSDKLGDTMRFLKTGF